MRWNSFLKTGAIMFRPMKRDIFVNFTKIIYQKMVLLFPNWAIKTQWYAMSKNELSYGEKLPKQIYEPRIDIAVGPFAMNEQLTDQYDYMIYESSLFLQKMLNFHTQNVSDKFEILTLESLKNTNFNPRCFMAIEVESGNKDSKYLIGSIINATALGKVAVLVATNDVRFRQVIYINEYIRYLSSLDKNITNPQNLIILSYEQIIEALGE